MLKDWFDTDRVYDDYAPTGFRRYVIKYCAVEAHPFGLDRSEEDRQAFMAFLKTL